MWTAGPLAASAFLPYGRWGRFYRHVLLEQGFPHHAAVAFGRHGAAIFEVLRLLGAEEVGYNRPSGLPYPRRKSLPLRQITGE